MVWLLSKLLTISAASCADNPHLYATLPMDERRRSSGPPLLPRDDQVDVTSPSSSCRRGSSCSMVAPAPAPPPCPPPPPPPASGCSSTDMPDSSLSLPSAYISSPHHSSPSPTPPPGDMGAISGVLKSDAVNCCPKPRNGEVFCDAVPATMPSKFKYFKQSVRASSIMRACVRQLCL